MTAKMPRRIGGRMPDYSSMLVLPFSFLLSGMALSSLTILTLAAAYLDRRMAGSDPKTVRRAHLTLVTKKEWQ
jgi:hypothetical protein